jgi:epsin
MNELAQMTYNQSVVMFNIDFVTIDIRDVVDRNDFVEIMEMLDKRLNDKGKNWRHVFKVNFRRVS